MTQKTLTEALQEAQDDVDGIIAAMERVGINPISLQIVSKALPVVMQGTVIAHAQNIDAEQVEDAIANVFLIGMAFLYKRRYKTRKAALDAGQATINHIAKELANNIDKDFPELIKPANMGRQH